MSVKNISRIPILTKILQSNSNSVIGKKSQQTKILGIATIKKLKIILITLIELAVEKFFELSKIFEMYFVRKRMFYSVLRRI